MTKSNNSHILHVVNIFFVLPYFFGEQFKYFHNKGYKLYVACSESDYLKDYSESNDFEYLETPINRHFSLSQDIKSLLRLCKYIRSNQIGIINGHTPKGSLLVMTAGVLMGVPIRIYFRHGLVYETSTGLKRFILKFSDKVTSLFATKIVCVSQSVYNVSLKDHLAPARKQLILGDGTCNGIDTSVKYNPEKINLQKVDALREKWGIEPSDFVIGYTGRLVRDKGIIELVKAFDILKKENMKLLLVGMFEERDALPDSVKMRILNDPNIIYTGYVRNDMEYYYYLMNVYVLASYREGFPTGTLEAQSMRIPVITTEVTGCCDSIVNGKTGLFSTHDPSDLADKITKIKQGEINGDECRKWVVSKFDSKIVWKEIEKLYHKN